MKIIVRYILHKPTI